MQFAKYLFKIANLHLITGEKAIPIYIIGAGAGAAGGGWEILAGGFGGRFWPRRARICRERENNLAARVGGF